MSRVGVQVKQHSVRAMAIDVQSLLALEVASDWNQSLGVAGSAAQAASTRS